MTFSLSSLSDFTATPGPAKSNIAPKELIGNTKFPEVLSGFQSSAAGSQAPLMLGDAKGEGPDVKGAGLKSSGLEIQPATQGAEFNDLSVLETPAYGNALPQPGTGLPPGLKGGLQDGLQGGIQSVLERDGLSSAAGSPQEIVQDPFAGPFAGPAVAGPAVAALFSGSTDARANIEADNRLVARIDRPAASIAWREGFGGTQADLGRAHQQASQQPTQLTQNPVTNAVSDITATLLNAASQHAPSDAVNGTLTPKTLTQAKPQIGEGGPSVPDIWGGKSKVDRAENVRSDDVPQTVTTTHGSDQRGQSELEGLNSFAQNPPASSGALQVEVKGEAKGEAINSPSAPPIKSLGQIAPTATPASLEPSISDPASAPVTSKAAKVEPAPTIAVATNMARGEQLVGKGPNPDAKIDAAQPAPVNASVSGASPERSPEPSPAPVPQEASNNTEAADPRANGAAAQIAQTAAVTSLAAKIAAPAPRLGSGSDLRALSELGAKRIAAGLGDLAQTQFQTVNPLQAATVTTGEAAPDFQNMHSASNPAPSLTSPSAAPSAGDAPAEVKALQAPVTQPQAAPALSTPQPATSVPVTDTSAALRLGPQLENTIEQLADTRSNAQANRPELTVRHQEFGAITMRLENTGSDLRATLSARDPGFVPAIQSALAERSIAAGGETSSANGNKGSDQGSANSNSQSNSGSGTSAGSQGHGWNSQGAYGSSTGSGQGTSQPYTGQTEARDEELGSDPTGRTLGQGDGRHGEGELFA